MSCRKKKKKKERKTGAEVEVKSSNNLIWVEFSIALALINYKTAKQP